MKAILLSGVLLMSVLTTNIASAQTHTPVISKHQLQQQHRIQKGIHHGTLTHREAANLRAKERKLHAERSIAKTDGRITRNERHEIRRDEIKTGHDIYEKKHNGYTRDIY